MDEASVCAEYNNLSPGPDDSAVISTLSALVRGNQIHGSEQVLLLTAVVCESERSLLNSVAKEIKVFPRRNWEGVGRVKPGG